MPRWLQTIGGRRFFLTNPSAGQVDFEVMARVLARIPRFNAHTECGTISVAQHQVEGARAILRKADHIQAHGDVNRAFVYRQAASAFSLHDGHEYVIGDLATPVADSLAEYAVLEMGDLGAADVVRRAIKALKANIDVAVFGAAGIAWPLEPAVAAIVKEYDARMCKTERDARMALGFPWTDYPAIESAEPVEGVDLSPWTAVEAETCLMELWRKLLPVKC